MKKFGDLVVKNKYLILIISLLLLIPSVIGYVKTRINYDILTCLPSDIETLKGEKILTDEFNSGAFSIIITEDLNNNQVIEIEEAVRKIDSVEKVISIDDITGTNIPVSILPTKVLERISKNNETLILVTFKNSTSDDKTLDAVERIRKICDGKALVGGMSAMVLDTKILFNSEMLLYVCIAVILCIIVLELSLDSYLVPFLLIGNIGLAILFNMGSNIMFGSISYITKAIVAILQLGVTTDFSIFLYHKYEALKEKEKSKEEAMSKAIKETFTSVLGSSLTTIAGFLALCTMKLALGVDIGLVMAKGVLIGVICVVTVFPAMLLVFDNKISKTKHKKLLPKFDIINNFVLKHYIAIFVIFLLLLIPAYKAQNKVSVYYKLDTSIPESYGYSKSTKKLKEDYNLVTQEMILIDKDIPSYKVNEMTDKINDLDGIDFILTIDNLTKYGITENMLPEKLVNIFKQGNYKMIILGSNYDIATDELNNQIDKINEIIKEYDKNAILAGEGPLTKDLVSISDEDFNNVNYASIGVIFVLMVLVLKSISLPVLLVTAIEFAIYINMGVPYFTGTEIPFIASIVIGTIQLGATIDYAILMTTKYLEERKEGKDKFESAKIALDNSTSSIFVSAMCFFAATIGVGIVSQIDLIGSLCRLISRGAIISMIVVIMVVPSILIIFDKLIIKTTLLKKKESGNMKKMNKKKAVAMVLVLSIIMTPFSTFALEKEETVYTKLNPDGSNKNVLVNEHFINKNKESTLEDLTDLENIVNINGDDKYSLNDGKIVWESKGNDIFFQGTTSKELPIKESITYKLNGKDITLDKLLGKKGKVEITIKYTNTLKNYSVVNGKSTLLYTPFVVATVTNFSNKNNSNITVTNGKAVDNGLGYSVVALSTPGLYESLDLKELQGFDTVTISLDTDSFELPTIYSVATPKVIETEDLDIFTKLDEMYSNIDQLESAMNELQIGSKTILDNLSLVSDGSTQISTNLNLVLENLTKIKDGTVELDAGLTQIVTELDSSKDDLEAINSKLEEMQNLINANNQYISGLQEFKTNCESLMQLKQAVDAGLITPTEEQQAQLAGLPYLKATYDKLNLGDQNKSIVTVLSLDNKALSETIAAFGKLSDAMNKLNIYLPKLKEGADNLSTGTAKLNEGVAVLNTKMSELSTGTVKLKEGMNQLNEGLSTFNKKGIVPILEVKNKAKDLTGRIEALDRLSSNYQSFSLKGNSTTSNTKFVFVTEGKSAPKEEKQTVKEEKKDNFFDRVLKLFS